MEDGHSRSVSRWYVAILYVFLSAAAAGELNAWIRNEATTNTVAGLTYAWPSSWDEPGTRRNERILFFGSAPVALCCFRERKKKPFRSTIGYKTLVNFALCGPWPSRVTDQPPPDSLSPSILSNWNSYFVLSYYLPPRESWWRELKVHLREVVKLMKISNWVYSTK